MGGPSPMAQWVKNPPAVQETQNTQVQSLVWDDPLEKEMATHPSILPGESQAQGNLVGRCLWGHTQLDTTEVT